MINLSLANNMTCIELAKALLDTTENSINSDLVKVLAEKCIADTEHYQMILSDYETSDETCSSNILDLLEEKRQLYIEVEKLKKQGINWQPMDTMPKDKLVSLKTKTGAIIKGKRFHAPYGNDSNYFYIEHAELFDTERVDRLSLSVNFIGWSELIEAN